MNSYETAVNVSHCVTHVAIILIITILILPTIAYSTIESSYLYGKGQGKGAFKDCLNFNSDCYTAEEVCQNPTTTYVRNETTGLLDPTYHDDIMTNQKACINGFIHVWNHECSIKVARENSLPCPISTNH